MKKIYCFFFGHRWVNKVSYHSGKYLDYKQCLNCGKTKIEK